MGIRRKNLREELYCQALLSMHLARSARETRLAWIFFALLVGCFLPPPRVRSFVDEILRDGIAENSQVANSELTPVNTVKTVFLLHSKGLIFEER